MQYARVPTRWQVREYAIPVAAGLLFAVCLPLLGVLAFALRTVLVVVAPIVLLAIALSFVRWRGLGEWWSTNLSPQLLYRGLRMSRDVAFHRGHSWALIESDVIVGADDLVQATLGPVDEIELPEAGRHVERGEAMFRLRHAGRTIDIPSPVSGTIVGTNEELRTRPSLINERPFGAGWVARVHADNVARDRHRLLVGRKASQWFRDEVDLVLRVARAPHERPAPTALQSTTLWDVDDATWGVMRNALGIPAEAA